MPLFNQLRNKDESESHANYLKARLVPAIVLALGTVTLATDSEAASGDAVVIQELTTPAGLAFWYYPLPEADRTAIAIDWAQEVPLGEGTHPAVAEVGIEIMLKGGAGGRDAAEIVADFEDLDAGSDLWVRPRGISGFIVAPGTHLSKAREIAHQVLAEPALEQRWFDREHQSMIESAIDERTNSWGMVWNLARELYLDDHPYNKLWSYNSLDEFEAVSLDDVKAWYKSSFSTNTATVAVAGSAPAELVGKEIDLLLADLPANESTKPIVLKRPSAAGKTILLHNPDAPKSILVLVGNFPSESEANSAALDLGVAVLGRGKNSRLSKTVRSEMGASYGFAANVVDVTQEHRMLAMRGEIETEQLQDVLNEIEQTYKNFRNVGIDSTEFPIFKRVYVREIKKDLQHPVEVALAVIDGLKKGFTTKYMNNYLDHIDSLDRNSVNGLIRESFPAYENMLKLIISPDEKAVEGACVITMIEDARGCL